MYMYEFMLNDFMLYVGRVIASRYLNAASKIASSGRHTHDKYGHSASDNATNRSNKVSSCKHLHTRAHV